MTPIQYPDDLPCPIEAKYIPGQTFIRSQFEFDIRERPVCTKQYQAEYAFFIEDNATMKKFRDFYYKQLLRGVRTFSATWRVEESDITKEFRFAAPYTPTMLGNSQYKITAVFDLITPIESL